MQESSIKIIFFGSVEFAVPALEALVSVGHDIVAVVTGPDKPAGRKKILTPPPIKSSAEGLKLNVLQPEILKNNKALATSLSSLEPEIGIVVGYGKIIPPEIFNLPLHGTLNIHPSLLPKYRGPSPVQTAILNGDLETGVTIMQLAEGMDDGNIVASVPFTLSSTASLKEAYSQLFKLGTDLLIKTLPDYLSGKIKPKPQDHSKVTITHKFKTEDGEIKSTDTAQTAYNKVRALNPEPGVFVRFNDKGRMVRFKILEASMDGNLLELRIVQLEGGRAMTAKEFRTGHPNFKSFLL